MDSAPKDGTRILLCYTVYLYTTITSRILDEMGIPRRPRMMRLGPEWVPVSQKWEEAWYDAEYHTLIRTGNGYSNWFGGWMPWCGQYSTKTSIINYPLGWLPRPGEENELEDNHQLDLADYKRRLASRIEAAGGIDQLTGLYRDRPREVQPDDDDD